MSNLVCPSCGGQKVSITSNNEYRCEYCGHVFANTAPSYAQAQPNQNPNQTVATTDKSRTTAALLGILIGGFGAHQFYLGNTLKGLIYLLLCWTYIPGIIGLIEGIMMLTQTDEEFAREPKLLIK